MPPLHRVSTPLGPPQSKKKYGHASVTSSSILDSFILSSNVLHITFTIAYECQQSDNRKPS